MTICVPHTSHTQMVILHKRALQLVALLRKNTCNLYERNGICICVQSEDSWDALSLLVISHNRALELVALLPKMTCNVRDPMHLCHAVTRLVCVCDVGCTFLSYKLQVFFRKRATN